MSSYLIEKYFKAPEKAVLQLYGRSPLKDRLHVFFRLKSCPFSEIVAHVPVMGKILDLGCSHGILSNWLALTSPERLIEGIDYSKEKIRIARQCSLDNSKISFSVRDTSQLKSDGNYQAIIIADMLYLVPFSSQKSLLQTCYDMLLPGGLLIIKEIDTAPRFKFLLSYFQETLSVKMLGLNKGFSFYFRGSRSYMELCRTIGFSVRCERLDRHCLHSHILYLAEKKR